jgi:hypothetical protein
VPDVPDISASFDGLLSQVDHAATSTVKYRQFELYLAGLLGIPAGDIYTTHVAKPGNFDVRMTQSARARVARLRVALLPDETGLPYVKDLAARIARDRDPGSAVLLVCHGLQGWAPRWGIEPAGSGLLSGGSGTLSDVGGWPPGFELHSYSHGSVDAVTAAHVGLDPVQAAELLYRAEPGLFTRLIQDDATASDVVAISRRQAVINRFRRLLEDPDFFADAAEPFNGRKEAVWQNLLEENPWILGTSLAGQVLTGWNEHKLEQVVAGFSISGPGKRSDAVMRTNGRIRAMVFAEIKHHETELLGHEYRPGCWAPSPQLSGGIVQVQQTVNLASRQINLDVSRS